jgi:hypothetical protein
MSNGWAGDWACGCEYGWEMDDSPRAGDGIDAGETWLLAVLLLVREMELVYGGVSRSMLVLDRLRGVPKWTPMPPVEKRFEVL